MASKGVAGVIPLKSKRQQVRLAEVVGMLWRLATPLVRVRLGVVVTLVVAAATLTALSPVALKLIVDGLASRAGEHHLSAMSLVTLYVLILWLARTANEVRGLIFAAAEQRIFRMLSEQAFSHLMRLPLRFHLGRQTGGVSQTLSNGVEGLRIILQHLVFTCLPVTVELSTVLLVLASVVTPPFLFLFCGALGCYVAAFGFSAATITERARAASAAGIDAAAAMMDGLMNYEVVKTFTAESTVQTRVGRRLGRCEAEWVGFYKQYARNGLLVAAIFAGFLAATAFYATQEVQQRRMTLGAFVLVNTYMLQVVRPVEMMGYAIQGLSQGVVMLEKLVQLFREPTEPAGRAGGDAGSSTGSLEFQGVCVSYGVGRPVLNKLSFRVGGGHTLGIVGPSGSGKSTVVRLLLRLLEPESGRILIDAMPTSRMALQELRRSIAVVPQDVVLFDDTIGYNIALGREGASAQEIERAARIAQLHDFVVTLPDGYATVVGERGVKLSGGERQRVSIARAVLKSPKIYVFDEATSSLDTPAEREIMRSIRAISRSNTTLIIAHRLSTVVHADEIIVLKDGEIAECGTHHALLCLNGGYAALWNAQRGGVAAA
jgi:ATP-binding cassette subfamily B protein